jgi:hypothetical protein
LSYLVFDWLVEIVRATRPGGSAWSCARDAASATTPELVARAGRMSAVAVNWLAAADPARRPGTRTAAPFVREQQG